MKFIAVLIDNFIEGALIGISLMGTIASVAIPISFWASRRSSNVADFWWVLAFIFFTLLLFSRIEKVVDEKLKKRLDREPTE